MTTRLHENTRMGGRETNNVVSHYCNYYIAETDYIAHVQIVPVLLKRTGDTVSCMCVSVYNIIVQWMNFTLAYVLFCYSIIYMYLYKCIILCV